MSKREEAAAAIMLLLGAAVWVGLLTLYLAGVIDSLTPLNIVTAGNAIATVIVLVARGRRRRDQ